MDGNEENGTEPDKSTQLKKKVDKKLSMKSIFFFVVVPPPSIVKEPCSSEQCVVGFFLTVSFSGPR